MSIISKYISIILSVISTYLSVGAKSFILTIKNFFAFILFSLYLVIFYVGIYSFLNKQYILSVLLFIIFSLCVSSISYLTGKIVKDGGFNLKDLLISFKVYLLKSNFILIVWFLIFYIVNQIIITPISAIIRGDALLYIVIIPSILLIFFALNTLPELIYLSDEKIETIFINSLSFMEKKWIVWLIPTIIFMFLINLFDHRFSIMPTIGYMDLNGIILKIQDISFYIRSLIITFALIFRGLLLKSFLQE